MTTLTLPKKVSFSETCLRDGLQNEKKLLTVEQKLEIINDLLDAGFKDIDMGSFVRADRVPQMAGTAELAARLPKRDDVDFHALTPNLKGLELAIAAGIKSVSLSVSASRAHNLANFNRTTEEGLRAYAGVVKKAQENGVVVQSAVQMAFGSPWEGRIPLEQIKAIVAVYRDNGVTNISLSDTAGVAVPDQVYTYFTEMQKCYPDVAWTMHLHNTRGVAMTNLFAALQAGITSFSTSAAGLGGCPFVPNAAGNLSTEDAVHMLQQMDIATGIDLDKLIAVAKKLELWLGHPGKSYILRAGKTSDLLTTVQRQK